VTPLPPQRIAGLPRNAELARFWPVPTVLVGIRTPAVGCCLRGITELKTISTDMARQIDPVCTTMTNGRHEVVYQGESLRQSQMWTSRSRDQPPGMHWQQQPGKTANTARGGGGGGWGGVGAGDARRRQKMKRFYRRARAAVPPYFEGFALDRGKTGEVMLSYLERRLDNIVSDLGGAFAGGCPTDWFPPARLLLMAHMAKNFSPRSLVKPVMSLHVKEHSRPLHAFASIFSRTRRAAGTIWN